jgi:hypothetical protein
MKEIALKSKNHNSLCHNRLAVGTLRFAKCLLLIILGRRYKRCRDGSMKISFVVVEIQEVSSNCEDLGYGKDYIEW